MYFADKCKEYVGIDLFQHHIDIFKRKIQDNGIKNLSFYPNGKANDSMLKPGIDDVRPGVFYYTMPKEIEAATR